MARASAAANITDRAHLPKADFITIYENVVRCIDREDNLIHYRLTWALQVNVVLAALLFVIDEDSASKFQMFYLVIIAAAGLTFTLTSLSAILAALTQLKFLRNELNRAAKAVDSVEFYIAPDQEKNRRLGNVVAQRTGFPRPYGVQKGIGRLGDFAPLIYCAAIFLIWGIMLANILV